MKLSTKGRYAVTALADMALSHGIEHGGGAADFREPGQDGAELITLAQISQRQQISLAYLEQLFARLRRADLVVSARGPGGGYRLARPASEIRISEIMTAVDETLRATKCQDVIGEGCGGGRAACLTHDLWEQLSAHVYLFLHNVTLADVIAKRLTPCNATPNFLPLLDEDGVDRVGSA
ncbi:MAG: Rrf2 family transcriptional regulator [Pseudomonadota bacterium]